VPFEALDPAAQPSTEWRRLLSVLNTVNGLQRGAGADFDEALGEINLASVHSVPGADYVGITWVSADGDVSTLGANDPVPRTLDDIQQEFREGPCLSAAWNQHTIRIDDLTTEDRWPEYRAAALARTPVRAVISYRLFAEGRSMAALNFYARTERAFDDESIEIGLVFAAHTTVAWNLMRREKQFQSALASRDVIGQAKGILMERFDIDAVAAFELLRRASQEANVKLVEIAQRLVASREDPAR